VRSLRRAVGEFLYGMTGYEFVHQATRMRHDLNTLLMVTTFGDLVGLPIFPPYYGLRLLPYVTPDIAVWKRQALRERHPLDQEEFDLIEM
jgi:hypothetical protein